MYLKKTCIEGFCSEIKEYTGGTNIEVSQSGVISAPNVYSKTETNTLLADKQHTLTAGDHIDITNNVISVDSLLKDEYIVVGKGVKIYAMKSGQTVVVWLDGTTTSQINCGGGWDSLATLPERYWPDGNVGSREVATSTVSANCRISSNGEVQVGWGYALTGGGSVNIASGQSFSAIVTYITTKRS